MATVWKYYPDIPSFIKGEKLANQFKNIYAMDVDEYVAQWLPEMGHNDLLYRLASDLGFKVKLTLRNHIMVDQQRNPHYEKAFPRDI